MRCMPLATDGGASIWITRSIAPMSMPSSSDEVADEAADLPGLQPVLDLDPLRPRQRAVVGADQRLAGELVQRAGQALGDAAAVDEDQRRAVRLHQFEQARIDRRSRSTRGAGPCEAGPLGISSASPMRAMSSTGTSIVSSSFFFCDVSTIVTGAIIACASRRVRGVNSSWIAVSGRRCRPDPGLTPV